MCIDNSDKSIRLTEKQIQFLCDRNFGVGADGGILMEEYFEEISEKIDRVGAIVENSVKYYPNRINVNFVAPINLAENKFQVSTFERGAGVTLACGTGASASFAHILKKYPKIQNEKVEIKVPGGTLFFEQDENKNIFMTGLSFIVFEGKIEV